MHENAVMKYFFFLVPLTLLIACQQSGFHGTPGATTDFHLPKVVGIHLDGDIAEWKKQGSGVHLMGLPDPVTYAEKDFSAWCKMGWQDPAVLIIAGDVTDDSISGAADNPWQADGIEFFFNAGYGSREMIQAFLIPAYEGGDTLIERDYRRSIDRNEFPLKLEHAVARHDSGWSFELAFHLDAFGTTSPNFLKPGLQILVHDRDPAKNGAPPLKTLAFHPLNNACYNPYAYRKLILSDKDNECIMHAFRGTILDDSLLKIRFAAMDSFMAASIRILDEKGTLFPDGGQSHDVVHGLDMDIPLAEIAGSHVAAYLNGQLAEVLALPLLPRQYKGEGPDYSLGREIRVFSYINRHQPPDTGAILFTGSSSIRRWYSLPLDLEGYSVINRGFGGSTMRELVHYADRIVLPYRASDIFVYEGDNDLARGYETDTIMQDYRRFIQLVKKEHPPTRIHFLSVKPSIARTRLLEDMRELNHRIAALAKETQDCYFVDVFNPLLNKKGLPAPRLFVEDNIHLNDTGYRIWTGIIRDHLDSLNNNAERAAALRPE